MTEQPSEWVGRNASREMIMMDEARTGTGVVVCPYRFSEQPAAMINFFEVLGLQVIIRRHDYAVLQGRGGRVAVHPVATSEVGRPLTSLTLEVPDLIATTEDLNRAGLDATWWDESWGRQGAVAGPTGWVSINAEMDDFHGYQTAPAAGGSSAASESPSVDVVAVVFTTQIEALAGFFARFGFSPGAGQAPGWCPLRADGDALGGQGVLGLHEAESEGRDDNGYLTAALGFETSEPLTEVAARLRAAGYEVTECQAASVPPTDIVAVIDPDGQRIEIHPARN